MNFISIYDNALSEEECKEIIEEFENNKVLQVAGTVNDGEIKPQTKLSTDMHHNIEDNSLVTKYISKSLEIHIKKYIKEYPDVNKTCRWSCHYNFNVQKYNPKEGYFKPHCEVTDTISAHRVLVWMFYLNTLKDGGTLFPSYKIGINAIKGRLVIWPAYWTHIHQGQISESEIKYIVTGWHTFVD